MHNNKYNRDTIKKIEETIEYADMQSEFSSLAGSITVISQPNIIYSDDAKEVRIEKQSKGVYSTIIISKASGTETIGQTITNPKKHTYNPTTDTWSAKI